VNGLAARFAAALAALPKAPVPGTPLVIAVSGGADSMAMWELLVRDARWPLIVWHLNHGLRAEAPADAVLIHAQAERYRVAGLTPGEIIIEHTDVADLARRWHASLEAAGRRHRYERLALVARSHRAVAVFTAHHRDDQSETVLANLLRGAGPVGTAGIALRRMLPGGVPVLRPLLSFARAELRAYCVANDVRWLEDASNDDQRHNRNFLRHAVLPGLEAGVPGITAALAELAERSRVTADALEETTSEVWQRALGTDDVLLDGIRGLDAAHRRQVWRRLVMHLGMPLDRALLERIDGLASGIPGRRLHLGRWLLLRRGNSVSWELARPPRNEQHIEIPGPGDYPCGGEQITCRVLPRPADMVFDADEGWLDAARCVWPLVWRPAGFEERFTPLGAPGRQTVVKFLSTRGVPSRLRPGASVVADAHGVVWVPGFTIAERVKLSDTTTDVVHLRWSTTCGTGAPPTVPPPQHFQDDTDERS
jgi:tRNA(Ile)-lysidine synthase